MSTTTNSKRKTILVATMLIAIVSASFTNIVLGAESSNNQCDEPIEYQSPKCNGNGKYVCGVCECKEAYFGVTCECFSYLNRPVINCRSNGSTFDCSGRGNCVCGVCDCDLRPNPDDRIYGKYCECDNFSCERRNGLICAGNGVCECGICKCTPGWTGSDCSSRI